MGDHGDAGRDRRDVLLVFQYRSTEPKGRMGKYVMVGDERQRRTAAAAAARQAAVEPPRAEGGEGLGSETKALAKGKTPHVYVRGRAQPMTQGRTQALIQGRTGLMTEDGTQLSPMTKGVTQLMTRSGA